MIDIITHLGSNKQYETPKEILSNLLEVVPRKINREQYNINGYDFYGMDVWNCYEFSTLKKNGAPVVGVLKIVYDSNSPNIVESKSLKLYLNSYNNVRANSNDLNEIANDVEWTVNEHLSHGLKTQISCSLHYNTWPPSDLIPIIGRPEIGFHKISPRSSFKLYEKESPDLLLKLTEGEHQDEFYIDILRSNCRVTNQPDWADVYVHYSGQNFLIENSLLEYIASFRNENHFHEECAEIIYKRLWDFLEKPKELFVACLYTRRGGIDINPIRASSRSLLIELGANLIDTTRLTRKSARH